MKFILGSGSPRRRELLAQLGITPDAILPPDIDEDPRKAELPRPYCVRLAREKAFAVVADSDVLILTADTTVALGQRIMGKPRDAGEAAEYLLALGGRRHQVITAVAVRLGTKIWARESVSQVKMKRLSDMELTTYLASGEWQGKAGGYGIQDDDPFVINLGGSLTNIVGLPMEAPVHG